MPCLLSLHDVLEAVYPPELEIDDRATTLERQWLVDHFQKMPNIIEGLERKIRSTQTGNSDKDIRSLHEKLLIVAHLLMEEDQYLTAKAAIDLAAIVLAKGQPDQYQTDVFRDFDQYMNSQLSAQYKMAEENSDGLSEGEENIHHTEWLKMRRDFAHTLFKSAARMISKTRVGSQRYQKVVSCLVDMAQNNLSEYREFVEQCHSFCQDSKRFPSAVKIVEDSYDQVVLVARRTIADHGVLSSTELLLELMTLHGHIVVHFNDIESIRERGENAFREDWTSFKKTPRRQVTQAIGQTRQQPIVNSHIKRGVKRLTLLIEGLHPKSGQVEARRPLPKVPAITGNDNSRV